MTTKTVNFDHYLSFSQIAKAIMTSGDLVTYLVQGEPGTGKSSILKAMQAQYGDKYHCVYVDCPLKDVGDIAANIPVHQTKTLEQYVASLFPWDGKPFIVMLDELLKANKLLKLMFTRMMLERTVGDRPMPEGSIVFATSNNASDGVGDYIEGHVGNRISVVKMAKPSAAEWLVWATDAKVHSAVRAWVQMTKEALRSYLEDGQQENPYIFNPARGTISFVSPRSLEKAGYVITRAKKFAWDEDTLTAALAGTIGKSAAENMAAFLMLEKEILMTADVLKDPLGCPMPDKTAAVFMMMFNAIDDILTQDDLTAFMQFIDRVGSREVESVFFTMLVQSKRTVRLAKGNKRVTDWAARNIELF
jgi:hypothetical protein